jgi:hypothetical protein
MTKEKAVETFFKVHCEGCGKSSQYQCKVTEKDTGYCAVQRITPKSKCKFCGSYLPPFYLE